MRPQKVGVIGSGMGALSAACLLAQKGYSVQVFEQNYIPGGCTTSYWRKGYVFEAGATTIVGMNAGMPLRYLVEQCGLNLPLRKLPLPMEVHMDGRKIQRFQELDKWVEEASRHFGADHQRAFWTFCYELAQKVWRTSTKQRTMPPGKLRDFGALAKNFRLEQLTLLPYAFQTMEQVLDKFNLLGNEKFVRFVNQQLLITAQNTLEEVNALFGATALCYTNFDNYYIDGGLQELVNPLMQYIEEKGGKVSFREGVVQVVRKGKGYQLKTKKDDYAVDFLISGIPINNLGEIFPEVKNTIGRKALPLPKLWSAFQMGIGFTPHREFDSIHHQIHLEEPLPVIGAHSIFISLSHPDDTKRSDVPGHRVISVSTHIPDPENTFIDELELEEAIFKVLEKHDFLKRDHVHYHHSSGPKSWKMWTGRAYGFVGGYPQFKNIKPWQMLEARLDGYRAYHCGDTAYPGQGIPGATLSGIIAAEKLSRDWR